MKPVLFTLLLAAGVSGSSYAQLGQLGGFARKAASMVPATAPAAAPAGAAPATSATAAMTKKVVAPQATEGATSPLHTKYMGKLVFAPTPEALALRNEKEAQFSNTFTLGQPIYFRGYMDNTLFNNAIKAAPEANEHEIYAAQYRVEFFLDGALVSTGGERFRTEIQYTTFAGALYSKDKQDGNGPFQEFLAQNEAKLTPGTHQLKVVFSPQVGMFQKPSAVGAPVATGELTLNVGATGAIDPKNTKMCLPANAMGDAKLQASVLQAFKAKGWPEKATAARIISTEWDVERNEMTGAITRRTLIAAIGSTMPDGTCRYQKFLFAQNYTGTAYQEGVYLYSNGNVYPIPCGCLK